MGSHTPVLLYQDNAITRARFDLSAMEMNILFHVLKQIRLEARATFLYQINLRDIIDQPDQHKQKRSTNHAQVRKASKQLISKVIDIPQPDGGYLQSALISAAQYQPGSGRLLIQVSELIKPYLLDIAKNTTRYYFQIAIKLKSVYAKRFYQFISQWRVRGEWPVSVAELRDRLQLQNSYKNYGDFKLNVLNVAMQELMLHADIYFTYEEIKDGKRVTDIHFTIKPNPKNALNEKRINDQLEQIEHSKNMFPVDPTAFQKALREMKLADWQIGNVLKTFDVQNNPKDLWQVIYNIRTMKTVKEEGAKSWWAFTTLHGVPTTKIK